MTTTLALALDRTAVRADLAANAILVAVPILRVEAAERWLGLDPLGPVAQFLTGHPWLGHLMAIPLDQATSLSRALTLVGTVLAILCGLALFRVARRLGLPGLAALAPAIACEFAPGLPAPGFDRSGLALLALLSLLNVCLQATAATRSPIPRIAAATALLAIVLQPGQTAPTAAAAILLGAAVVALSPRPVRTRVSLRLLAGAALGLCLAFPFTALGLLAATPSELVARFGPLVPVHPFDALHPTPGLPDRLAVLLPPLGLAAIGLASGRRGAAVLPAALGFTLLASLVALIADGAGAASPVIPIATGLLAMLALDMNPPRALLAAMAVLLCAAALWAALAPPFLPSRRLAIALAVLLLPPAARALGRAPACVMLVICTAGAWILAP